PCVVARTPRRAGPVASAGTRRTKGGRGGRRSWSCQPCELAGQVLGPVHVVVLAGDQPLGVEAAAGLQHRDELPAAVRVRRVVADGVEEAGAVLAVDALLGGHVLAEERPDL